MDSGSTLDLLLSMETAEQIRDETGREIYEADDGDWVVFGKEGSEERIVGYMYGEGLIGRASLAYNIRSSLVGLRQFTRRGMEVVFSNDVLRVMSDERLVVEGT